MRWFYSAKHELHDPDEEVRLGTPTAGFEVARRARVIAAETVEETRLRTRLARRIRPRIHRSGSRPRRWWIGSKRHGGVWSSSVISTKSSLMYFDTRTCRESALRRESPTQSHGSSRYYSFDTMTPIVEGTYEASRSAVDVALSALESSLATGDVTYGLCRPPGHHASASMVGGYCFFNNAAIVAAEMARRLNGPVAVIDVDYHHGNGTQSIFYARDDVFYTSLHGSPDRASPYYLGYGDERGVGRGAGGTTTSSYRRAVRTRRISPSSRRLWTS